MSDWLHYNINVENNEIYKIPGDIEKGYIAEILMLIGQYMDTMRYIVDEYKSVKREVLKSTFKHILRIDRIKKDNEFLSVYPSLKEIIIDYYIMKQKRETIILDIINFIISQFNEHPKWKLITNTTASEIVFGIIINMDIEKELRDFILNEEYGIVRDERIPYFMYILCSQYDVILENVYRVVALTKIIQENDISPFMDLYKIN